MKNNLQLDLSSNRELSDEVREYVQHRLGLALGRFDHRIGRVQVRCEDVNGPRGGEDKVCRIHVAGRSSWRLQVEGTGTTFHRAVDAAAGRARRSVAEILNRLAEHRLQAVA